MQGAYVDGELHGPWRKLDAEGKPLVDGTYDHGRKSGVWTERRSNGSKLSERTYAAGAGTGKWTFYDAKDAVVVALTLGRDDEVALEEEDGVPTTIDVKPREGPSTDDARDGQVARPRSPWGHSVLCPRSAVVMARGR